MLEDTRHGDGPVVEASSNLPKVDALDYTPPRLLTNAEWCESVYASADGDPDRVPWCRCGPDGLLLKWLGSDAPRLVRPGCRAVVVGCGLGDDVAEMAARGFDVVGFDVSNSAVRWAARRFPSHASRFLVSDLLDLPLRMVGRFDLVIEICTLQSMAPELRSTAVASLARLAAPRGVVLAISCGKHDGEEGPEEGPPWPFSACDMDRLMTGAGLTPMRAAIEVPCGENEDHVRVMGAFTRG
ncbi:MAG: class I SAM-dependent methyltransferase [Phycisphaerales bacterium]